MSGAVLSSSAGLTVSSGATSLLATTIQGSLTVSSIVDVGPLSCTALTCSSAIDTGSLSCTALSCSSIVDAGALSCTALTCTGITDAGALGCVALTVSGSATLNGGLSITGPIINSSAIPVLSLASGDVALALGGSTAGTWSIAPALQVSTITITGASAGATFDIIVSPSASIQFKKALSAGTVTIYNNLSGNTSMASGSKWLIRGKCISASVVYLEVLNFT